MSEESRSFGEAPVKSPLKQHIVPVLTLKSGVFKYKNKREIKERNEGKVTDFYACIQKTMISFFQFWIKMAYIYAMNCL